MSADSNRCALFQRRKLHQVFLGYSLAIFSHVSIGLLGAAPSTKLRYLFAPRVQDSQLILQVAVDMEGIESSGTELVLPSFWGDATRLARAVVNLKTESPGARIVDTADPSKKLLHGFTQGRARISYDLVKDWEGALRESVRHRAHLEPTYLEVNTSNALVHPKLEQSASVDCMFDWTLPPRWSIATSFGTGALHQRFRGAWDTVENALFVAGDFRLHQSKMGKGSLIIAVRGKWTFPDEEATSQIIKVIRLEREFWKDDDFPYYLVTLVPFGPGQSGSGGGGFTNAFSLHTSPESSFSSGVLSLLTHEVFHTWNPYKLGRIQSPAEGIYWFTEGFTTYYQDLLLWRAGLLSLEGYIQAINRIFRDYSLSPVRNTSMRELIERSRDEQVKGRISYERGAVTALWLDWTIRQNTQAKSSLDTLMFDLFREARRQKNRFPDLTPDRVFKAASRYINPEDLRQLRSYVELGSTIEAPAEVFGPCIIREMVEMPRFELGMNRTELIEKHTVAGLQSESEAQKSGLQEGDAVIGTSVYWNDTSKPVKLTIRRGQATSTVEYYPRGPSLGVVPQYALDKTRYHQVPQSCQALVAIR